MKLMTDAEHTQANRGFHAGKLDLEFFIEESEFACALGGEEIPEMKIGVEDKAIDKAQVSRERPAHGTNVVNFDESKKSHRLAGFDELPGHLQCQGATQA